jgi:acetyl esterase/lipase
MRKKHLLVTAFILQLASANFVLAQESNLNEDYSAYMPEVRAFNKQLAQIPQTGTTLTKEGLLAARKTMESFSCGKPLLQPSVKNINGPAGNIALRIFKPDTIRAVVMDIHGGAWSVGTAASDDRLNDEMARTCKVAVVSVDYRLAPRHHFLHV